MFGYVTKLVIPISSVEKITREKTAKFFPNAIALQLNEAQNKKPHVFGSFLSREAAYNTLMLARNNLMISIDRKNDFDIEPTGDEVDMAQSNHDVSSLDDSSSISGSEMSPPVQPMTNVRDIIEEEPPSTPKKILQAPFVPTSHHNGHQPITKVSSCNMKLIVLTFVLAFFSGLLLFKISTIEQRDKQMHLHFTSDSVKFTFEDAESILNRLNRKLLIVKTLRKKLEDLRETLSLDKIGPLGEKREF